MAQNGCGAIAVYNLALLLGKNADFPLIAKNMEKYALSLFGIWGISPARLPFAAKKAGIELRKVTDHDIFEKQLKGNAAVICTWNSTKLREGMHYMTLDARGEDILVYNRYNDLNVPSKIKVLDEITDKQRFVAGFFLQ